jgi:hypothetical protein
MLDVHLRLGVTACGQLQPEHLHTFSDPPEPGAAGAEVRGQTEWVAAAPRTLTFSWDWAYDPHTRVLQGLWHTLRTNLQVVEDDGTDLGDACTRLCVARLMTRVRWEHVVARALDLPLRL